jgi:hypothetical protein
VAALSLAERIVTEAHYNIAENFSPYTGGRYAKDGSDSGEALRAEIVKLLREAQQTGGKVIVSLDGAVGYSASFLDEAFGGLVREEGFSKDELAVLLEITNLSPIFNPYRELAKRSIAEAREAAAA